MANLRYGETVRVARHARGWSRETLSARSGVSVSTILRIELHAHPASLRVLTKLARALDCTVADLFAPVEEQAS